MPPVTDLSDVRVMIPRVRRALVGPLGSGFVQSELSDNETAAVIADAIGDVILYSGSAFGKTLIVTERDSYYQAPVAWKTSGELDDAEQAVIALQAALNYVMRTLSASKVGETIKRADEEWSWSISAQAVAERLKELRAQRDAAIDRLSLDEGMEAWVNTLLVRDSYTDTLIEPWVSGGAGGQLQIANPDHRFGGVEWLG